MDMLTKTFILLVLSVSANAAALLPEVDHADIEYASPKAAYDSLSKKQNVAFSKDDTGWTVAFDKSEAVIWSFAPASEPSFPVVVKRTVLEKSGGLFIKMAVMCGGSKEACDEVVKKYTAINEKISRGANEKSESKK
jgi:hypothetical protein